MFPFEITITQTLVEMGFSSDNTPDTNRDTESRADLSYLLK